MPPLKVSKLQIKLQICAACATGGISAIIMHVQIWVCIVDEARLHMRTRGYFFVSGGRGKETTRQAW